MLRDGGVIMGSVAAQGSTSSGCPRVKQTIPTTGEDEETGGLGSTAGDYIGYIHLFRHKANKAVPRSVGVNLKYGLRSHAQYSGSPPRSFGGNTD